MDQTQLLNDNYIYNNETRCFVKKNSQTGRKLLRLREQNLYVYPTRESLAGYIYNPETRCFVKREGQTGKKLLRLREQRREYRKGRCDKNSNRLRSKRCDGEDDLITYETIPDGCGACMDGYCYNFATIPELSVHPQTNEPMSKYSHIVKRAEIMGNRGKCRMVNVSPKQSVSPAYSYNEDIVENNNNYWTSWDDPDRDQVDDPYIIDKAAAEIVRHFQDVGHPYTLSDDDNDIISNLVGNIIVDEAMIYEPATPDPDDAGEYGKLYINVKIHDGDFELYKYIYNIFPTGEIRVTQYDWS